MKATSSFKKIGGLKHKTKIIQGSQGAGKTFSVLLIWILKALKSKKIQTCSIVTDTFPALRKGAIKDFNVICQLLGINYTGTKTPYVFKINKWTFEFYSVDKEAKGRGGRRDRLFINEANRMSWSIARQLISRTHVEVICDFNPVKKFWAHRQFVETGECDFIKLTYKDNEELPISEIEAIERHAPDGAVPDENFWRVFGLGEVGFVEGQIFKGYNTFSSLPENTEFEEGMGIDLGDVDPTTLVKVWVDHKNKRLYWKELYYKSQESNLDLIETILESPDYNKDIIRCEHQPKVIREIRSHGISVQNANKKGGLIADIKAIKQYNLFVHEDSENLINEVDEYSYKKENDKFIDYPDQKCEEHAIDAARYATISAIIY